MCIKQNNSGIHRAHGLQRLSECNRVMERLWQRDTTKRQMMKLCIFPASISNKLVWYNSSKQCICITNTKNPSISLLRNEWVSACWGPAPSPMLNAIFQIAATRFFQIAAITYFVCVSTFTPEQNSKSTRISMDVLPTIYWHMPSICYNTTKQNADADQAAAWQAPAFSIFRREPCCQYKSSAHPQLHLKI